MSLKLRAVFAILVGIFGLIRAFQLWHAGAHGWPPRLLLLAGLVLLGMGLFRLLRKPADPASEWLK